MAGEKDKLQNYFGFLQCNGNKDSFVQKWMMMVIVDRKAFFVFSDEKNEKSMHVICDVCVLYLFIFVFQALHKIIFKSSQQDK